MPGTQDEMRRSMLAAMLTDFDSARGPLTVSSVEEWQQALRDAMVKLTRNDGNVHYVLGSLQETLRTVAEWLPADAPETVRGTVLRSLALSTAYDARQAVRP